MNRSRRAVSLDASLVGVGGFEPPTSRPQTACSSQTELHPVSLTLPPSRAQCQRARPLAKTGDRPEHYGERRNRCEQVPDWPQHRSWHRMHPHVVRFKQRPAIVR